jgi:hypothetical protein
MYIVRLLEKRFVIRLFGIGLIVAPFMNMALHLVLIKVKANIAWSLFQFWPAIKETGAISLLLATCSVVIGSMMLSGAQKAWKYVLILIGAYLLVQILNIGSQAWKSPLAWPSFILNAGLFFFIFDQLVWKVKADPLAPVVQNPIEKFRAIINLTSYRKILFSFGSDRPWGELKTLSSEMLSVKSIAKVPDNIENKTVQINFSKDVVIDIQFFKRDNDLVYFKPLNLDKEKVTNLNRWLNKIAV